MKTLIIRFVKFLVNGSELKPGQKFVILNSNIL
jgi:hypothetical protein